MDSFCFMNNAMTIHIGNSMEPTTDVKISFVDKHILKNVVPGSFVLRDEELQKLGRPQQECPRSHQPNFRPTQNLPSRKSLDTGQLEVGVERGHWVLQSQEGLPLSVAGAGRVCRNVCPKWKTVSSDFRLFRPQRLLSCDSTFRWFC